MSREVKKRALFPSSAPTFLISSRYDVPGLVGSHLDLNVDFVDVESSGPQRVPGPFA